jgi:PDZ domain
MKTLDQSLASRASAIALGFWFLAGSMALSDDGPAVVTQKSHMMARLLPKRKPANKGTLGYGPPGLQPGVQGFGLGYHPGYGYGGDALGPGAEGGYPFYGGPGYPHPGPCLARLGPITPFAYYGGPGGPIPGRPNFFDGVGPLVPDKPVVTFANDYADMGYGCFDGSLPYPESTFAPFTSMAVSPANEPKPPIPPTPPSMAPEARRAIEPLDSNRSLGIETKAVVDAGLARGLRIDRIQPGSLAETAGLQVGDVIRSANGYLTEQPGNLTWIFMNAASDNVLTFNVLSAKDGEVRTITARKP